VSTGKDSHFQIPVDPVKVESPAPPYDPFVALTKALKEANRAWKEIQAQGR
jgi:hypothetical protein